QVVVREAWKITAPPPAGEEEAEAMVEAAGDAADDAGEVAEAEAADDVGETDAASEADGAGEADQEAADESADERQADADVPPAKVKFPGAETEVTIQTGRTTTDLS